MTEVREGGFNGENRLYIDPQDNVLNGSTVIMRYLGIKSITTLIQWVEVWALPCVKLPNGLWMTTMTAIDQWIFMVAEMDAQNRPYSRGSNKKFDIALEQAQRRADRAKREKLHPGPIMDNELARVRREQGKSGRLEDER